MQILHLDRGSYIDSRSSGLHHKTSFEVVAFKSSRHSHILLSRFILFNYALVAKILQVTHKAAYTLAHVLLEFEFLSEKFAQIADDNVASTKNEIFLT